MLLSLGVAFGLSVVIAALLTPWIRNRAIRNGVLDTPECSRKIHTAPMPRLGGVAVAVAFFGGLVPTLLLNHHHFAICDVGILAGGLLAALLGVFDDLFNADARLKFGIQAVVAVGMWATGLRIDVLRFPFGVYELGVLSLPTTVIWIVGITNAVNLIDGLDGLAVGVAGIALAGVASFLTIAGQWQLVVLPVALAGALFGFFVYNRHPATIFLGDSGSLFLGTMLAALSIRGSAQETAGVSAVAPLLLLALPIFDTSTSFGRRLLRGVSPFKGDRDHVHHRLLTRIGSHPGAVRALYCVAALFAAGSVLAASDLSSVEWLGVSAAGILTVGLLSYLTRPATIRRADATVVPASIIAIDRRRTTSYPVLVVDQETAPRRQVLRRDSI